LEHPVDVEYFPEGAIMHLCREHVDKNVTNRTIMQTIGHAKMFLLKCLRHSLQLYMYKNCVQFTGIAD